jgi:hypothetical protein
VRELRKIVLIHDLKTQCLSVFAIARKVGCDRKTMRKYLDCGLEAPFYGPRQPRARVIEPFEDYLRERIQAFPDLSGARLLREIRALGYDGGYTAVTDFVRKVRPPKQTLIRLLFDALAPPKTARRKRPNKPKNINPYRPRSKSPTGIPTRRKHRMRAREPRPGKPSHLAQVRSFMNYAG